MNRGTYRKLSVAKVLVASLGAVVLALTVGASAAQADSFTFTSCHLSGGCGTATSFGTVTLTQVGTSVTFDISLITGDRFVETGAGGDMLFAFNDTVIGSTVTSITATLNGSTFAVPGGLSGSTNLAPFQADGTGLWTAGVFCTDSSQCNGGSTPTFNDLHFTVTNATLAQLETSNALGNIFIADILCGQTGCGGLTGPVDVHTPVPEPTSLFLLGSGLFGMATAAARRRKAKKQQ